MSRSRQEGVVHPWTGSVQLLAMHCIIFSLGSHLLLLLPTPRVDSIDAFSLCMVKGLQLSGVTYRLVALLWNLISTSFPAGFRKSMTQPLVGMTHGPGPSPAYDKYQRPSSYQLQGAKGNSSRLLSNEKTPK